MTTAHSVHLGSSALSRRGFLKTSASITALAVPYYVPASVFGDTAPSNRINMGCIGVGNQGFPNLTRFLAQDDCQVVAVCDVNRGSFGYKGASDFHGRDPAKEHVERFYAKKHGHSKYIGCKAYSDYRDLLARDDIDAVMIATPDHWHELMTIDAAEAGKDIYCEKPLGLTVRGQRRMIEAVRSHHRIFQTGTHERSNSIVRQACELVRSGAIGTVKRVSCHIGRHNKVGPGPGWHSAPVPKGFDYDFWLGPAPSAPYHPDRCLYRFRFNYDYSGGQVTNFGVHSIDMAQWGLGTDATGPVQIEHVYADYLPEGSLFNAATHTFFRCRYASGAVLECFTADPEVRCTFEGTDRIVRIDDGGANFVTIPRSIKPKQATETEEYHSGADHVRNFLDCVRARSEPTAPIEIGHRSTTICHLGNIALGLQATLTWDPDLEQFAGRGSDEANSKLDRPVREACPS